jgi:ankyrin repeat protein
MKSRHGSRSRIVPAILLAFTLATAHAQQPIGQNDQLIHDVARMGKGDEIGKILQANPAMRDARTGLGSTPLHMAATNPDIGALKVLMAAGADVNAKDVDGNTPLHMAAYSNRFEHSKLLLEAGADINATNSGGRTPIAMARKARADDVVGLISLWTLKGCKAGQNCMRANTNDIKRLVD